MSTSFRHRVASMASGTLASRVTGLLRVLMVAWVLGFSALADSYNLANTVPNMLYDLILGGVASATFLPVFVDLLGRGNERRAWRSISSIVSVSVVVLGVATLTTWLVAPWIIDGFTVWHQHAVRLLDTQRRAAVSLLRWFAPQIFLYGVLSLSGALLNARHRFGAMAWAPLANNIVCIVVLFVFHLSNPHPTLGGLHGRTLLLLGGGTTLGVLVQYLVLTPALHRAKLTRLRWHLDLRDEGVRKVMRLGGWTTANVVANQVSLAVILALAFGLGGTGSVSAYTYGWSFMQMPYAVVVVSVLNALTPALAADASQGQLRRVETNARRGLTNSLYVIVPATVFLVGLAQPIVALLFQHGNAQSHHLAGVALAVLAIGLPGFTVFAVMVRLLQTMQHGRDTFFLYAVQNVLTIFLAFAWGRHSLAGLLGSISVAYTLAAALAVLILSTRSVNVVPSFLDPSLWRLCGASLAGGLAMVLAYNAVGWQQGVALFIRAGCAGIIGILVVSLLTKPLWKRFLPFSANRDKVDGE